MFNSDPYQVSRTLRRTKPSVGNTYAYEDMHIFFVRTPHGRHKYMVEVKVYADGIGLIDFRMRTEAPEKYRVLTGVFFGNQGRSNNKKRIKIEERHYFVAFARFVRTVLDILLSYIASGQVRAIGFYGADLLTEDLGGALGKRSSAYANILIRTLDHQNLRTAVFSGTGIIFVTGKTNTAHGQAAGSSTSQWDDQQTANVLWQHLNEYC